MARAAGRCALLAFAGRCALAAAAARNGNRVITKDGQSHETGILTTQTRQHASEKDMKEDVFPLSKIQSFEKPISKTRRSDKSRFLFVAGLGGTGHHGWSEAFQTLMKPRGRGPNQRCASDRPLDEALRKLWYKNDGEVDVSYALLVEHLRRVDSAAERLPNALNVFCLNLMSGSLLSYPDFNSPLHHPNLISLAAACEDAGVDLRIIVIHREPMRMIASLSRRFKEVSFEALQMANQAALLNAQVDRLDPSFLYCVPFNETVKWADRIQSFLFSGLRNASAEPVLAQRLRQLFHTETNPESSAVLRGLETKTAAITLRFGELYAYWSSLKTLCGRGAIGGSSPNRDRGGDVTT